MTANRSDARSPSFPISGRTVGGCAARETNHTNLVDLARFTESTRWGPVWAVIGGGAAGVLTAIAIARAARRTPITVLMFEPRRHLGRGLAYSTEWPTHLLNVPAGRLGASANEPAGFVSWLHQHGHPEAGAAGFVPRATFGDYLSDALARTLRRSPSVRLVHIREPVLGISPASDGLDLTVGSGVTVSVRGVVLALGNLGASVGWASPTLRFSPRFVPDPWAPGALGQARTARSVLLVGTGLTMVDVALVLGRSGVALTAVSPSGQVARAHRPDPLPPVTPPVELRRCTDAARMVELVQAHIARCHLRCGDWRPAVDGLRTITTTMWQNLPESGKRELLRQHLSWWNRRRHRMPPRPAVALNRLIADGSLGIRPGKIATVSEHRPRLQLGLTTGSRIEADLVINCVGQQYDYRQVEHPLIRSLLAAGTARPGPLGLGLDTADGQIVAANGLATLPLYTLGAARIGQLWETTAIPEIRQQAADLAQVILDAVRADRASTVRSPIMAMGAGQRR